MNIKKYIFLLFLLIPFYFTPSQCKASSMLFTSSSDVVQKGDLVKVNLYLETGGDTINAAEAQLAFPGDLLAVSDISFSGSVLNFWPEEPHLIKDGIISFSGVTPGGFSSADKNLLFSVVFKAIKEGTANLGLQNASALEDDGAGTPSSLSLGSYSIKITTQASVGSTNDTNKFLADLDPSNDKELPESFIPLVGSSPDMFGGKYFLVFTTSDKQSGIDHYEVQESRNNSSKDNAWVETQSPYVLLDQTLHSFIFVRAFDKAQNVRMETVYPLYPQKFYQSVAFWIIIVLVCLVIFLLKKRFYFSHNEK